MSKDMNKSEVAKRIIDAVSKGLNPVTGEKLQTGSIYLKPQVISALMMGSSAEQSGNTVMKLNEAVNSDVQQALSQSVAAANAFENMRRICIRDDYLAGVTPQRIAQDYECSMSAVLACLIDEGLLSHEQSVFFTKQLSQNSLSAGRAERLQRMQKGAELSGSEVKAAKPVVIDFATRKQR